MSIHQGLVFLQKTLSLMNVVNIHQKKRKKKERRKRKIKEFFSNSKNSIFQFPSLF